MLLRLVSCFVIAIGGVQGASPVEITKKTIKGSGLPVPRFVMTKGDRVNLRVGPGNQYPARTTYVRKNIPLMVVSEFDFWRKVKDIDGQEGWIHKNLLAGTTKIWVMAPLAMLISHPGDKKLLLKAERFVEGEYLKDQEGPYVRVKIAGQKGWMLREHVWGVLPN